jgi:hypothetical protein
VSAGAGVPGHALGAVSRRTLARAAAGVVLAAASLTSIGCGAVANVDAAASEAPIASSGSHAGADSGAAFRFFAPSSFWNEPLPQDAAIDRSSPELISALAGEAAELERDNRGPWINTRSWSVPIYTVGRSQPRVRVRLQGGASSRALQRAWDAVPLPPDAQPAGGTDQHLVVWQPSTNRLWEFWRLVHGPSGWHAAWGGAMRNVSRSPGVYGYRSWPGAKPWWGASASSLSIAGGLITLEDLKRGRIEHALSLSVSNIRAGVYSSPANRDDGQSESPSSLPEGARLRLPAQLDLAALHLPKLTLMIAEAAQRYGLVVRDRSYGVAFFAQDPISTGGEPYTGPGGYFEGHYPNQLLASFPWQQLQVLELHLHPNGFGSGRG